MSDDDITFVGQHIGYGGQSAVPFGIRRACVPAKRAPRFRRVPRGELIVRSIHEDILRALGRFGILNTRQLEQVVTGISASRLRKHAAALYHHSYLGRPNGQQAALYDGPGSKPLVFCVAPKGARLLAGRFGLQSERVSPDIGRGYLAHELEIRDVLVSAAVATRGVPGLELVLWPELRCLLPPVPPSGGGALQLDEWQVHVSFEEQTRTLLVRPDAIFAFKRLDAPPERAYRHYFLEVDRGSMPIARRDLYGSSITRKFLCYAASYHEGIHRQLFNARTMRALIVTTSRERVSGMIEAFGALAASYDLPARLFLFTDRMSLLSAPDFLAARWLDGAGEERTIFG